MTSRTPTVVLDTNVFLETHSCYDIKKAYEECHATAADAMMDAPDAVYRRGRMREALLLAIYFHKHSVCTYSLHSEPLAKLEVFAPPGDDGLNTVFATQVIHFVKDALLFGWEPAIPSAPDGLIGNAADRALLAYARVNGLPLITNEGYTKAGMVDQKLRKDAKAQQVRVYAPFEFYKDALDEDAAIAEFLKGFEEAAPPHIAEHCAEFGSNSAVGGFFDFLFGFYRHILTGVVAGTEDRAKLSLRS